MNFKTMMSPWRWRGEMMSISLCWRRSWCSSWASARRTSPGARWWRGRGWCTSRPRARWKIQYRYLGLYLQFPTGDPWHSVAYVCCLCAWKLIQTNHECRGSWEHETVLCDKIIFMWDCHYHNFYIRAIVHRQLNLLREFSKQDYKKLNWQKISRDLSYLHISPFTCCCRSEYWGSQLDSPSPLPWTWCYGYYYYT